MPIDNKNSKISTWPVLGNKAISNYLYSSILSNQISHAYLFYGPEQIGKKLFAELFAKSLQCQSDSNKIPCNQCVSCQQIEKKIHPDIYSTEPGENGSTSINQIRELQHALSLRSFLTSYKISIIDQADRMTNEAANSLLKTLEEPPPKTVIILISKSIVSLPLTIISRCQTLQYNFVPTEVIYNWLIVNKKHRKDAHMISHLSNGRPGMAYNLANQAQLLADRQGKIDILFDLINSNIQNKIKIITNLTKAGNKEEIFANLDLLMSLFRDIFLQKNSNPKIISNLSFKDKINQIQKKYTNKNLVNIIINIEKTKSYIQQNINPQLALENLTLNI